MGLIESKGNMYTWTTHQWNPIGGDCIHGCTYCYVNRWGKKPPLNFKEKYLKDDLGKDRVIFVVSGGDMFAKNVPDEWIYKVLEHCNKFDNKYLFQSKNPGRFLQFNAYFPLKTIPCTTIETNRFYPEFMQNSPEPYKRVNGMFNIQDYKKYVTIEPIMDFDLDIMVEYIKDCDAEQINIGADSGNNHLPEPSKDKLLALIDELKKFTIIDQKRNLQRLLK
jgi:protein gp37